MDWKLSWWLSSRAPWIRIEAFMEGALDLSWLPFCFALSVRFPAPDGCCPKSRGLYPLRAPIRANCPDWASMTVKHESDDKRGRGLRMRTGILVSGSHGTPWPLDATGSNLDHKTQLRLVLSLTQWHWKPVANTLLSDNLNGALTNGGEEYFQVDERPSMMAQRGTLHCIGIPSDLWGTGEDWQMNRLTRGLKAN